MADVSLRSPFTGGIFQVPPEHQTPEFIEALIKAGFTRLDADAVDTKKKPKK